MKIFTITGKLQQKDFFETQNVGSCASLIIII